MRLVPPRAFVLAIFAQASVGGERRMPPLPARVETRPGKSAKHPDEVERKPPHSPRSRPCNNVRSLTAKSGRPDEPSRAAGAARRREHSIAHDGRAFPGVPAPWRVLPPQRGWGKPSRYVCYEHISALEGHDSRRGADNALPQHARWARHGGRLILVSRGHGCGGSGPPRENNRPERRSGGGQSQGQVFNVVAHRCWYQATAA